MNVQSIKLVIMIALGIYALTPLQASIAEPMLKNIIITAQLEKPCKIKGNKFKQGGVVIDDKHQGKLVKIQCNNGKWIQFFQKRNFSDFKVKPGGGGPSNFNCTPEGGCNCWGNDDCKKLVDSGKCHGNPISCDPNNPSSCHCD